MIRNNRYFDSIPAVTLFIILVAGAFLLSRMQVIESGVVSYCMYIFDTWWSVILGDLPIFFISSTVVVLAAIFIFFQIRKHFYLSRTKYLGYPKKLEKIVTQYGFDKVYVHESKFLEASCVGVFFPKIQISKKLISILSHDELLAVLLHERHHQQRGHMFIHLGISFLHPLRIGLPFLADVFSFVLLAMEKDADRAVVREMGSAVPLLSAFRKTISIRNYYGLSFSEFETIERRIFALQGKKKSYAFSKARVVSTALVAIGLMAFFVMPSYAKEEDIFVDRYCRAEACVTQCAHRERVLYEREIRYSSQEGRVFYSPGESGK